MALFPEQGPTDKKTFTFGGGSTVHQYTRDGAMWDRDSFVDSDA